MPFGYCAWDHGTSSNNAGGSCASGSRLNGTGTGDQYVIAIVSAGPDGIFQTSCNDYVDGDSNNEPDTPLVQKASGSDDLFLGYTYSEAAASSGGLWQEDGSNEATIARDVTITDGTNDQFAFEASSGNLSIGGSGQFPSVRTDNLQAISGSIALLSNFDAVTADGAITGASLAAGAGAITGGSLDVGSGAITTTGALNAGTSTLGATGVSSLDAGSGAITTTGTLNAGDATLGATGVSSLSASGLIRTMGNTELGDDVADSVTIAGITTIGGTLDVTGDTSLSTLNTSGLTALDSLTVTNATALNGNVTLGDANTDVLTANANIAMSGNKITGLATPPTVDTDAATKKYVDDQITSGVPGAETDPQVGTITANKWCVGNAGGTAIDCTADANAETDPQVGTLTTSKWCTTDGATIDCTSDAPSGLPTTCSAGEILEYDGAAWQCIATPIGGGAAIESAFRVHRNSTNPSVADETVTIFNFSTKTYDLNSEFDMLMDRFKPKTAGYYYIHGQATFTDLDDNDLAFVSIHKNNGNIIAKTIDIASRNLDDKYVQTSTIVYMDGVSDYVDMRVWHNNAGGNSNRFMNGDPERTYFEGFKLGGGGGGKFIDGTDPNDAVYTSGNVGIGTADPIAKLHVAGGLKIGTHATCTAPEIGTIRYVGGATPFEYCDGGGSWLPFRLPQCQDDDTGACTLSAARINDDPQFKPSGIRCGDNILGVTGTYGNGSAAAFTFTDITGAALSTLTNATALTVSGIPVGCPGQVEVAGDGSPQISVNGGPWATSAAVSNGETLAVRLTSSASFNTAHTATISIGSTDDAWLVTTRAANNCSVAAGTTWSAGGKTCTVPTTLAINHGSTGSRTDSSEPTTGSATWSCNDGTPTITTSTCVESCAASQTVNWSTNCTASSGVLLANGANRSVTNTAAGYSGTRTITCNNGVLDQSGGSCTGTDSTPNAFTFTDVSGANPGILTTSNTVTISGISTAVSVTATGGAQFSIAGGAWTTSGTITNGQSLAVRLTSSGTFGGSVNSTVTVGSGSDNWSVTTRAANNCSVAAGTSWTAGGKTCTVPTTLAINHGATGSPTDATAPTTGSATWSCNDGTPTITTSTCVESCAASQTVNWSTNCTASSGVLLANGANRSVTNTAAGYSGTRTITCNNGVLDQSGGSCTGTDSTPNAFNFTNMTGQNLNVFVISNTVTISGLTKGASVSISGAGTPRFSIAGGAWVTSGTIQNGQSLRLRLTSANAFSTTRTATVNVGGVTDAWAVTTMAAPTTSCGGFTVNRSCLGATLGSQSGVTQSQCKTFCQNKNVSCCGFSDVTNGSTVCAVTNGGTTVMTPSAFITSYAATCN